MNREFVEAIAEHYMRQPLKETVEGHERLLVPSDWKELRREIPEPAALEVSTLKAVADYLTSNRDALKLETITVHVDGPTRVDVIGHLGNEADRFPRHRFLTAKSGGESASHGFGSFHDSEDALVWLLARCADDGDRDRIVNVIGGLKDSKVRETFDDGYAQKVTTAAGVTSAKAEKVENPVVLAPFRTFSEVPQPASPFVLRLKSGGEGEKPRVGFFEADGGAWRLEAVASIVAWLVAAVPDDVSVIG